MHCDSPEWTQDSRVHFYMKTETDRLCVVALIEGHDWYDIKALQLALDF